MAPKAPKAPKPKKEPPPEPEGIQWLMDKTGYTKKVCGLLPLLHAGSRHVSSARA